MQHVFPALVVLMSLALAPAAVLGLPARGDGPVLAVMPPWADRMALLAAARARPIGPVAAPFAVMADGPPGVADRLRQAGAWAVLDARRLAALCTPEALR